MDCRDAQFYLRMRRQVADELGADVTAPLDQHLATCPACAADARAIGSFDRAVGRAMMNVPVPAGLRGKLVAHVASKRGEALRRRVYQYAAMATAALLLIGIGAGIISNTRPTLDVSNLVERNGELSANKQESTERWLAAQNLPDRLPLPFDYGLLTYRGHETVQGRDVPVLVFRSRTDGGFAAVYVFSHDSGFNLKNVPEVSSSHARAQVLVKQGSRGNVTYLFVHTGGPSGLESFLLANRDGSVAGA
ncbi:hypothetical protein R5W23_002254 [Gemmata sp. JC673]|uniref:Zinc-finger domain-containing protein n=1 Tax=Gemmata algarum TaxID=2975278 RepID=A0ABU5F491_9BACT|nr:hypothetical protein [Gemmata algarum]MDY3560998.1 hypothetical protein [Gemmata algarum]